MRPEGSPLLVGRYALFREIASGGMASVHLARLEGQAGFSRTVAVKRMHPHCAREPSFVAMFVDEARLAARIHHPNVVATHDVVAEGGELFVVMDYVAGESLARLVAAANARGELLPPDVVTGVLASVLHGLHAAHEAKSERGEPLGLVHRDVSGQNILVGEDGVARVVDFGVAKAAFRLQTTKEGQVKGKLAYMAPEQFHDAPVTRRTDVYAAGVVLWEALTGRPLFLRESEGATINEILSATVKPPSAIVPGLPRALDAVVLRALERDPDLRFATAREMATALGAAVPPASASRIGETVERLAAEALAERRAAVAAAEQASSVRAVARALADDEPTRTDPTGPVARERRRRVVVPASVALAVVALGGVLASARSAERAPRAVHEAERAPRAGDQAERAPRAGDQEISDQGIRERSVVPMEADASVAAAPPPTTFATAPHPHARPRPVAPVKAHCDPPWTLDAAGVKRWKPDCR